MYEAFDDTAAQVLLALDSGDSIRRVAQRIHTPYETVQQAVNPLEDAGYVAYDDGLSLIDDRVRDAAYQLSTVSAQTSPPTIEEAYAIPQYADAAFAFTRIDAVYVWTPGGFQVSRGPDDYPLFIAVDEPDLGYWEGFFEDFGLPTARERQPPTQVDGPLQVVLEPRTDIDVTCSMALATRTTRKLLSTPTGSRSRSRSSPRMNSRCRTMDTSRMPS